MFYESKNLLKANDLKIEQGKDLSFPLHLHGSFELITVTDGEMKVVVDGTDYLLTPGYSILVFPNQTHELITEKHSSHYLCIFSSELVRAYSKTAKMALDAAGIAVMQPHLEVLVDCPYSLLEIVRKRFDNFEAVEESADFGASVLLTVYMPTGQFEGFCADIIDVTNGQVEPMAGEEKLFARRITESAEK